MPSRQRFIPRPRFTTQPSWAPDRQGTAVHLARYASHVTLLVRGSSRASSMPDYLIMDAMLPEGWKLEREPLPLETNLPGVFAAGDERYFRFIFSINV